MPILQLTHILVRVNQNNSLGGYVIANVDTYICYLHLHIFSCRWGGEWYCQLCNWFIFWPDSTRITLSWKICYCICWCIHLHLHIYIFSCSGICQFCNWFIFWPGNRWADSHTYTTKADGRCLQEPWKQWTNSGFNILLFYVQMPLIMDLCPNIDFTALFHTTKQNTKYRNMELLIMFIQYSPYFDWSQLRSVMLWIFSEYSGFSNI